MATYSLKKSYQLKDLREINFKDLWDDHGIFTTMWIFGRPAKILFFKSHINNLIKSLKKYGIIINPYEDTMLVSYTLDAGLNRHNLDTLSEIHLGHKTISYKDITGTGKNKLNFADVNLKEATMYAAEDADVTLRLFNFFKNRLDQEKLNKIYEVFEKPMVKLLAEMETKGIKVNKNYLMDLSKKFQTRIENIEKNIYTQS